MTVSYTINHAISDDLETWLVSQPDFISIDKQDNSASVFYDHASVVEEDAFKALLAKQIGLAADNVNVSDPDLAKTSGTIAGGQTFTDAVTFSDAVYVQGDAQIDGDLQAQAFHTVNLNSFFEADVDVIGVLGLGGNLWLPGGAGTKIGTAATEKLAFYGATPVVQPAANADTSGASLTDLEIEVNQLKALLRSLGLMAT